MTEEVEKPSVEVLLGLRLVNPSSRERAYESRELSGMMTFDMSYKMNRGTHEHPISRS